MTIDVIDHKTRALSRLLGQFHDNDDVKALIGETCAELNFVEVALQQILTTTNIDDSEGVQLDVIGRILQQPRGAKSDATYRLFLKARAKAMRASGSVPEIYGVISTTDPTGTWPISPLYPANMRMDFLSPPLTDAEALDRVQLLRQTKAGGVGFFFFYLPDVTANVFQFYDGGVGNAEIPYGDDVWGDSVYGGSGDGGFGNNTGTNGFGDYWSTPVGGGELAGVLKF